jgi:hypothetical protein
MTADNPYQELIAAADQRYASQDWAAAMGLYRLIDQRDATLSRQIAAPLAIGHCLIELAGDQEPNLVTAVEPTRSAPEMTRIASIRLRVVELCRNRDFLRASWLLRLLCGYDGIIRESYAKGLLQARSSCSDGLWGTVAPVDPPFLAEGGFDRLPVEALKARHHGRKVLFLVRRPFIDDPLRQHDFCDNLARTAQRFGLVTRELNSHFGAAHTAPEQLPVQLQAAILEFGPDVIYCDDLYQSGATARADVGDQVAIVLQRARAQHGAKVVNCYPDAWMVPEGRLYRGLGQSVDLVHHMHPTIFGEAAAAERAATLCYL